MRLGSTLAALYSTKYCSSKPAGGAPTNRSPTVGSRRGRRRRPEHRSTAVSYTHLTLPTILLV
eukprot:5919557-Pyramimonas_sp.AAC.1